MNNSSSRKSVSNVDFRLYFSFVKTELFRYRRIIPNMFLYF